MGSIYYSDHINNKIKPNSESPKSEEERVEPQAKKISNTRPPQIKGHSSSNKGPNLAQQNIKRKQ